MPYELLLFRLIKNTRIANKKRSWIHFLSDRLFVFGILCLFSAGYAKSSDFPTDKELDLFFRQLVENTTIGYVLYGEKPVDLQGFRELEQTIPGTAERKRAVVGLLAQETLKQCPRKVSKCLLSVYSVPTGYEILSINRKAFLTTVQANQLLFASRFGTLSTPQSIVDRLVNEGFASTFKEHIALQGIILGYGTENAITYELGSSFLKSLAPKANPPFKMPSLHKTPLEQLARIKDTSMFKQLRKFGHYKPKNQLDKTKIPFSYLTDSADSQKLISKYQKAQLHTEKALSNPHFLSDVCDRFGIIVSGRKENSSFPVFSDEEKAVLSSIVARTLLQTFPTQISPQFVAGMKDAAKEEHLDVSDIQLLDLLWQRAPSLTSRSHIFLKDIAQKSGIKCKVPGYLYVATIKPSSSDESLTPNHAVFKARYLIQDLSRTPLSGSYQLQETPSLYLEELMPGLAHGLIGMRKGEIREIYIHPDIAYGPSSELGGGNALIAKVELLDLESPDTSSHLPLLQPIDVQNHTSVIHSTDEFISLLKKHAYACGFRSWRYYKQAEPLITLEAVLNDICQENTKPLSSEEKMTLLKLEKLLLDKTS